MNSGGNTKKFEPSLTYSSYLKIDELLQLQTPRSTGPEHDEMLFIIVHQTYELWFKCVLHELSRAQQLLELGDTHASLPVLGRVRTIFKVLVSQVDILETMTPLQFNSFRDRLEAASGFQSVQFRELEAVLGRRDPSMIDHLEPNSEPQLRVLRSGRPACGSRCAAAGFADAPSARRLAPTSPSRVPGVGASTEKGSCGCLFCSCPR